MKITLLTGRTFDLEAKLGFPVKINRSPLARRLTLRIDEKNRLPVLTVPPRCSEHKALEFVESHRDWITNMMARLPQLEYLTYGSILSVMGQPYTICHCPDQKLGVELSGNQILVSGKAEFLHRRVVDFLKKYAHQQLEELSRQTAALIDQTVHHVVIKDTKSRWGSCSNKGNINYNWRIVLAPSFVINYLICHEVAHLAHQNHSPAFWKCVASLCPEYKEGRAWLKNKGRSLYQIS